MNLLIWDLLGGVGFDFNFELNGNVHIHYYLLVDGIYPWWSCFISTIHESKGKENQHFSKLQKATCKMLIIIMVSCNQNDKLWLILVDGGILV
jgi:hypothetical protein